MWSSTYRNLWYILPSEKLWRVDRTSSFSCSTFSSLHGDNSAKHPSSTCKGLPKENDHNSAEGEPFTSSLPPNTSSVLAIPSTAVWPQRLGLFFPAALISVQDDFSNLRRICPTSHLWGRGGKELRSTHIE